MHERLALIKIASQLVLDAGCGAGGDLAALQKHYPLATLLGLDASFGMLDLAMGNQAAALSAMQRLLQQWLPAKIGSDKTSQAALVSDNCTNITCRQIATVLEYSMLPL